MNMTLFEPIKIGIVGLGFVGNAVKAGFLDETVGIEVVLVDKDKSKGPNTFEDLYDCKGVFVCVPTPFSDDGSCDTSILEDVLEQLKDYDGVIISKCTAPPLVYKELNKKYPNLVHSPEFLTAANSVKDYLNGEFLIVGGRVAAYVELAERLIRISQPNIKRVGICSIEEASLAKYTINSFLATKVVFMNELYHLAKAINADYDTVAAMVNFDTRIGTSHMKVPGPDGEFGFGGMCFPKDTAALLSYAQALGVQLNVLDAAVKKNTLMRLKGE